MIGFVGAKKGLEMFWPAPEHQLIVELFALQAPYAMHWTATGYRPESRAHLNLPGKLHLQAWRLFLRLSPAAILRMEPPTLRDHHPLQCVTPQMRSLNDYRYVRPSTWLRRVERLAKARGNLPVNISNHFDLHTDFENLPKGPATWLADLEDATPPQTFIDWFAKLPGQLILSTTVPEQLPDHMPPREIRDGDWLWTNSAWPPTIHRLF